MDNISFFPLDEAILQKYSRQQAENKFTRTLEGVSETVTYLPGSSIRFWLNDEPVEYALHWHPAM